MRNRLGLLVLCCLATIMFHNVAAGKGKPPKPPQFYPVRDISVTGDQDKRINIVFVSEGYTADEMGGFLTSAQASTDVLFNTSPYMEYQSYFNVYAIEVPSRESGPDHPGRAKDEDKAPADERDKLRARTAFGSTFDYSKIHRLLVCEDSHLIIQMLQDNLPAYDIIFVIVNSDWYGGSGGGIATYTSGDQFSLYTAIHELGHSFAILGDEYGGGGTKWPLDYVNVTQETDPGSIPWRVWIEPTTPIPTPNTAEYHFVVGLFQGANYSDTDWYRPRRNCKMRSSDSPFGEVCVEQTVRRIYNSVSTIESHDPASNTVTMSSSQVIPFSVVTNQPMPSTVSTNWLVDGTPVASETNTFQLDGSAYNVGSHQVKAVAADLTSLVRDDPNGNLVTEIVWDVQIDPAAVAPPGSDDTVPLRDKVALYQNVPNPFNPVTTIRYFLPGEMDVVLTVHDLRGRRIRTLVRGRQTTGDQTVSWNGTNDAGHPVSSGIYFYRLRTGQELTVRKMLLLK